MNFNNFTIKSQEAVQEAVNLVKARGQQAKAGGPGGHGRSDRHAGRKSLWQTGRPRGVYHESLHR